MRELKISLGNSRQSKFWSNKGMTYADICERLKVPIRTSETVEEYIRFPKSRRDEIKDKGGFVGGHLRENRRKIAKEPLIKAYAASAEPFPFPFCQRFEVSGSKSDK